MFQLTTHTAENLPPAVAEFLAANLCRQGSEMQQRFQAIAEGRLPPGDDSQIAVATLLIADEPVPVGWASIEPWADAVAIQASVYPSYRRRGLATALVACLALASDVPRKRCHVFSPHFPPIAQRAGFLETVTWKRVDDGWVKCSES